MTARTTRMIGLVATGALAAGALAIPPSFADSPASGDSGSESSFYRIDAAGLAGDDGSSSRAAAKVATSKNLTVLQSFTGRADVGAAGIGVAAGPGHVVQISPAGANIFTKSTGAMKGKTLNGFFNIEDAIAVSDPTVEYDPVGKRWIIGAVTDDAGDVGIVVRVSKKSSPTKWFAPVGYATAADPGDLSPNSDESQVRVGVTSDKVVVTAAATGDPGVDNRILLAPKPDLYNGDSPDAWIADVNSTYDGLSPAVNATKQANAFITIPAVTDVTVTTYTGKAKANEPTFSKSVMFPNTNLATPPIVDQGAAPDLDLGALTFDSAWRSGKLYAAATSNCAGDACVRVFGVGTNNGVNLLSEKTLSSMGSDFFTPSVAIDGVGNVHVASTFVDPSLLAQGGPELVARTLKASNNSWTNSRTIASATAVYAGTGDPTDWIGGTAAALDPTAPWDAWVTGAFGSTGGDLASKVARVSLAKNIASLKVSDKQVRKGSKVKFVAKLSRPGGDTIQGLPIALTKKKGKKWPTVGASKTTDSKGKAKWTLKIKKAAQYKAYGKAVKQVGGQGLVFEKVYSKGVKIRLS